MPKRVLCPFHERCAHDWGISPEHPCAREINSTVSNCPLLEIEGGIVVYKTLVTEGSDGIEDRQDIGDH